MTNWLTPENFKIYIEHLKEIDNKVEEQIQRELRIESEQLKESKRKRKYLKYLVLPE